MYIPNNLTMGELAKMALQKPEDFGYWGSDDMFVTFGFTGHDQHDGSDCLTRSNFRVISKDLMERFPDDFRIEGYRHWAVNHVDRLVCRVLKDENYGIADENITWAFRAAIEWHKKLEDYPVADEEDFIELEYEEILDSIKNLPSYLLNMIDTSGEEWASSIYDELSNNMYVEMCPDAQIYPSDTDILTAVYNLRIWNSEMSDEWQAFCDENDLQSISSIEKYNPNQLSLFED